MAETAKILNPHKKVLIPSAKAGCSLAASITASDVVLLKKQFPGVPVVTYVNTTATVKAETDICCTSSNAQKVIESLKSDRVIFLPDEYLAQNVARQTHKKIIFPTKTPRGQSPMEHTNLEYQLIGWPGRCEVHEQFTLEDIENIRRQFPDVLILAHPECSPEVTRASDFSGSTSQMIRFVQNSKNKRYVLLTECSMGDNIQAENRDKEMLRLCSIRCPHMNQITLEDTLESLILDRYEVTLAPEIIERARRPIDRMLAIG
jgi:quinolinate synthase